MEDFHVKETSETHIYDEAKIDECIAAWEEAIVKINQLVQDLIKKYDARAKIDLRWICDFAVDNFYDSRDPLVYKRRESLYKAYEIIVDNGHWEINRMPDKLEGHHQSSEIIYNNVFLQGFHGGSWGTDERGETVSSPTWRTPVGKYTYWGANAAQAPEAPNDEIHREFINYMNKKQKQIQEEFNRLAKEIIMVPIKLQNELKNSIK